MTKQDYIKIAQAVSDARSNFADDDHGSQLVIADLARRIAHACADDNRRFDYARFYAACGIKS